MRRKVVAGNWKMHKNYSEAVSLVSDLKNELINENLKCDVIVCPPFTFLEAAHTVVKSSEIQLGAQNMHFEEKGAFTGEVSAEMLKSVGCEYVILGHSERRKIFEESDETINKKVRAALAAGLRPIFCIGETLEEREGGKMFDVLGTQLKEGLKEVDAEGMGKIIVAYEPVWAIGTGKTATPDQAEEAHQFVRKTLGEIFDDGVAEKTVIQYGGSVKPNNAAELLAKENIDGALVGGACLEAESFLEIVRAAP
ncbi:MAG: triose-phosphate isomerase [Ignavibacteriales bacterium]|nr:triose-phosphate isomerase [Ignavibacteriales bacterium]